MRTFSNADHLRKVRARFQSTDFSDTGIFGRDLLLYLCFRCFFNTRSGDVRKGTPGRDEKQRCVSRCLWLLQRSLVLGDRNALKYTPRRRRSQWLYLYPGIGFEGCEKKRARLTARRWRGQ